MTQLDTANQQQFPLPRPQHAHPRRRLWQMGRQHRQPSQSSTPRCPHPSQRAISHRTFLHGDANRSRQPRRLALPLPRRVAHVRRPLRQRYLIPQGNPEDQAAFDGGADVSRLECVVWREYFGADRFWSVIWALMIYLFLSSRSMTYEDSG